MCTVRLRHKDKIAKCRFFVVPGDGPALLGMPDIELLDILKIMCKVMVAPEVGRNFDFKQCRHPRALLQSKQSPMDHGRKCKCK